MFHSAFNGLMPDRVPATVYCASSTTNVKTREITATSRNFVTTVMAEPLADKSMKMPKMNSGSAGTMSLRITASMMVRNSMAPRKSTLLWNAVRPIPITNASTSALMTPITGGSTISVADSPALLTTVRYGVKPDPDSAPKASRPPPARVEVNSHRLTKYASKPARIVEP